jgi:hypothetical protein
MRPEPRVGHQRFHVREGLAILLFTAIIAGGAVFVPVPLLAQGEIGGVTWSEPVRLSDPSAVIQHSTVAADPWGGVHVFWSFIRGTSDPSNVMYYTRLREAGWPEPRDVLVGTDGDEFSDPYATCDSAGDLHLIWVGGQGLYYSSTRVLDAADPRAWKAPQLLVQRRGVGEARLIADGQRVVHVVYAPSEPGANVMYARSDDGGTSWLEPAPVSQLLPGDPQAPDMVRLAMDSHGQLHLVWSENHPPSWIGQQVFYARSSNGGATWTLPRPLSPLVGDQAWSAKINVAVDSNDDIHVVWVCGEGSAGRCTRSSYDGGSSWSQTQRLFDGLIGVSGWDAMAVDPYDNTFWFGSLRQPQAQYFSVHSDRLWRDPPLSLSTQRGWEFLVRAHFPSLVVAQGNTLHLILVEGDGGPLWYVQGHTSHPSLPTPILPTPTPSPSPKLPAASEEPGNGLSPTPLSAPDSREPIQASPINVGRPVAWAALPVLLLLVIVVAVRGFRNGR